MKSHSRKIYHIRKLYRLKYSLWKWSQSAYIERAAESSVTDLAWSVVRSVTIVSPAKTAEPIEMPFGLRTRWAQGTMY